MTERMTGIMLPGVPGAGIQDYGRKTVPEMVAQLRDHARRKKAIADAILAAADEDFFVSTYLGSIVERDRTVIQQGRSAK